MIKNSGKATQVDLYQECGRQTRIPIMTRQAVWVLEKKGFRNYLICS